MNKEKLVELILEVLEEELLDEEGKKDACYHKVKSRYKVWPSAYQQIYLIVLRYPLALLLLPELPLWLLSLSYPNSLLQPYGT